MNQIALAQALADHFDPPHWEQKRKTPKAAYRHLPVEEQYSMQWVARTPESQPYIVDHFTNEDGARDVSMRAANYLEIAEAVLKVLNPRTLYRLVDKQGFPVWSSASGHRYNKKEDAFTQAVYLEHFNRGEPIFVEAQTTFNELNTEWTRINAED